MNDFLKIGSTVYIALKATLSLREVEVSEDNIKSLLFYLEHDALTFLFKDHVIEYLQKVKDREVELLKKQLSDLECKTIDVSSSQRKDHE